MAPAEPLGLIAAEVIERLPAVAVQRSRRAWGACSPSHVGRPRESHAARRTEDGRRRFLRARPRMLLRGGSAASRSRRRPRQCGAPVAFVVASASCPHRTHTAEPALTQPRGARGSRHDGGPTTRTTTLTPRRCSTRAGFQSTGSSRSCSRPPASPTGRRRGESARDRRRGPSTRASTSRRYSWPWLFSVSVGGGIGERLG